MRVRSTGQNPEGAVSYSKRHGRIIFPLISPEILEIRLHLIVAAGKIEEQTARCG